MNKAIILAAVIITPLLLTGCGPSKHEQCKKLSDQATDYTNGVNDKIDIDGIHKQWKTLGCTSSDTY